MKTFITRCFAFFVILSSLSVILITIVSKYSLHNWYQNEVFKVNQLYARSNSIEALAMGNSANHAINFEAMNLKGYHIWFGGQDFYETHALLKYIKPKLPKVKVVFIPISYMLRTDNEKSEEKRVFFYILFPGIKWIKSDFKNWIKAKIYLLNKMNFHLFSKNKDFNRKYFVTKDGLSVEPYRFGSRSKDSLIILTQKHIESHKRILTESLRTNIRVNQETDECIEKIIQYCLQEHVRVIFYAPPCFPLYMKLMGDKVRDDFISVMAKMSKKYNIEYYDYSSTDSLIHNDDIFRDSDHLNLDYGAPLFSKILYKDMSRHEMMNSSMQVIQNTSKKKTLSINEKQR